LRVRVVPVLGDAKERTLLAPTCSEAAEAAFLVVATSLTHGEGARDKNADGPATERAAAAGAPGPPAPPPLLAPMAPPIAPAERPATAAAKSSSEPPGEARLRLVTSVYGGAQFVSLPTPAAFFDLGLGLSLKRVLVSAHFSATLPQDVALPRTRGGAEVSLMAGGIDGCFLAIPVLRGCAGFELGHIQARGYDVAKGREASAFWSALRLGATFAWPLGRHWAALANANIIQSFQSFDVLVAPSGAGYRYQLRSPGLRLGLGLELAW
jgi:hypothetical protein